MRARLRLLRLQPGLVGLGISENQVDLSTTGTALLCGFREFTFYHFWETHGAKVWRFPQKSGHSAMQSAIFTRVHHRLSVAEADEGPEGKRRHSSPRSLALT